MCRIVFLPQGLQLGNREHEVLIFCKINDHVHTKFQLTGRKMVTTRCDATFVLGQLSYSPLPQRHALGCLLQAKCLMKMSLNLHLIALIIAMDVPQYIDNYLVIKGTTNQKLAQ